MFNKIKKEALKVALAVCFAFGLSTATAEKALADKLTVYEVVLIKGAVDAGYTDKKFFLDRIVIVKGKSGEEIVENAIQLAKTTGKQVTVFAHPEFRFGQGDTPPTKERLAEWIMHSDKDATIAYVGEDENFKDFLESLNQLQALLHERSADYSLNYVEISPEGKIN